jgi:outer membrane protein assembly factor BamB
MPWMRSLAVVASLAAGASAADWPQWLGPRRDNSSTETVAPWKEAPKAVWRKTVGEGHSSPIVAAGKVFLHTKVKDKDAEEVAAYDAADGKLMWSKQYDRGPLHQGFIRQFGVGPRATPAFHNGRLYTLGVTGILACWDAKDGKQLWKVDTAKDFGPPKLGFGVSCSPLLEGDAVLINVGAKGASIVAFNGKDGKVLWKALDDPPSYSSGIAFGANKARQIVFLTGLGVVSLTTEGKENWRVPLKDRLSESSTTPVKAGDVLLASSVTFGSMGIRLGNKDSKPTGEQAWKNPALTCYFSTPVAVGKDHVYLVTGSPPPFAKAVLRCVEIKTGKELWKKDKVGTYHASLLRTGDDKLLMLDDFGNLSLLEPSAKEYKQLARSKVCGQTWAHPALSGGRLYLRDRGELSCLPLPK